MAAIRNVLFVTADQWRADTLSCAGHPAARTPALDRLAAGGVRFARHYAQATPCAPSRASLYTGMYLANHRVATNGTPLDARHTNVALEARALGYAPALFGYTDTAVDPRTVPAGDPRLQTYESVLPGFDAPCHLPEGDPAPWLAWLAAEGYDVPEDHRRLDDPAEGFPGAGARGPTWAPPRYDAGHTQTRFLTDRVLEYLEGCGERPWFVHVSYLKPHPPYRVPAPYHDLVDPAAVPPPARAATVEEEGAQHPFLARALGVPFIRAPESERDVRQLRATYCGMCAEVDHHVGRLLDGLDALGRAGDTLVVFTSDHGDLLGDHWLVEKLAWFDGAYHVPMIVRDPRPEADGTRGAVVDAFTEHVDVTPTILDLLGRAVPRQCDGRTLRPFLEGAAPAGWRQAAHWEWDWRVVGSDLVERALGVTMEECNLAVRRDAHGKYVHFAGEALPPVYYDLDADPHESVNRAGDPEYAGRVLDAAQRMLSWRMRHQERTLTAVQLLPGGPIHRPPPGFGVDTPE